MLLSSCKSFHFCNSTNVQTNKKQKRIRNEFINIPGTCQWNETVLTQCCLYAFRQWHFLLCDAAISLWWLCLYWSEQCTTLRIVLFLSVLIHDGPRQSHNHNLLSAVFDCWGLATKISSMLTLIMLYNLSSCLWSAVYTVHNTLYWNGERFPPQYWISLLPSRFSYTRILLWYPRFLSDSFFRTSIVLLIGFTCT